MSTPSITPTAKPERTLGQLVSDASRDLSAIVRAEVALAKAEVKVEAKTAALGGAMFAVAGVVAFLALILLLVAAAYGLVALGLSPWLAFLIVAVVLLVLAAVLALVGKSRLAKLKAPERTVRTAKETVATLKLLGNGFIITALIWGAAIAKLIDGRFRASGFFFFSGALLCLFGVRQTSATTARAPCGVDARRRLRLRGTRCVARSPATHPARSVVVPR